MTASCTNMDSSMWKRCFQHALVLSTLTAALGAQSTTLLLREGDLLPGGDRLTAIIAPLIDDKGIWLALVDSDRADLNQDSLILQSGLELLREGSPLSAPAGSTVDEVVSFWRSGTNLDAIFRVRLSVLPSFEGLYHNGRLLAMKDALVSAPEVPAGTSWDRFDTVKSNAAGTVLVLCEIRNPSLPQPREDALVRFTLDRTGAVQSTSVLLTKGMALPSIGGAVNVLGSTEHALALNQNSDFITMVATATESFILKNLDTVLARSGTHSPIPGRNYRVLNALPAVTINDNGEYAFTAVLDGDMTSDFCIIKNGQKFVQEGDVLPGFPSGPVDVRLGAPIYLTNGGDLFWVARDANGEAAFMRNDQVIVQEGKLVKGHLVSDVESSSNAFHVSPDGRYFVGRVELENVGDALVFADFGLALPLVGCSPDPGRVRLAGGAARVGQRMRLELDGAPVPGALPVLLLGTRGYDADSGCGLTTRAGELLIRPGSVRTALVASPWSGAPAAFDLAIPDALSLVGRELFVQGAFVGPSSSQPRAVQLTEGMRLELGEP